MLRARVAATMSIRPACAQRCCTASTRQLRLQLAPQGVCGRFGVVMGVEWMSGVCPTDSAPRHNTPPEPKLLPHRPLCRPSAQRGRSLHSQRRRCRCPPHQIVAEAKEPGGGIRYDPISTSHPCHADWRSAGGRCHTRNRPRGMNSARCHRHCASVHVRASVCRRPDAALAAKPRTGMPA